MTTIAANKDMMVSDSKVTLDAGVSYPAKKIVRNKKAIYGAAGHSGDCSRFLEWAMDGMPQKNKPKYEGTGSDVIDCLIVTAEGLFFYTPSYSTPERIEADFYAIGSGGKAARAAMLMGADPMQAVEVAIMVDNYSGPPITVYKLNE